jgi:hypothetical protein
MLMFSEDPHVNFPRQQLKYVRELGRGWFGRVSSHWHKHLWVYLYSKNDLTDFVNY